MSCALISDKSRRQRCVIEEHGEALSHVPRSIIVNVGGTWAQWAHACLRSDGDRQEMGIMLSPLSPANIWSLNSGGVRLFMMCWLALIYVVKPQINTKRHFLWPALISISAGGRSWQEMSKHLWISTLHHKCTDEATTYVLTWFCIDQRDLLNIYIHPVTVNLCKLLNKAPNKSLEVSATFCFP